MKIVHQPAAYLLLLAVVLVFTASDSAGQSRKRKRAPRSTPPVMVSQPVAEPLIISRAEDFPDQNVQPEAPPVNLLPSTTADDANGKSIEDLRLRLGILEAAGKDPDQKQKRLLLYLDILTKAEQRSESLRKQLFDMIEKETSVKTRLDAIEIDVRPESIEKNVAMAGSLRPEELRESRRKSLAAEKANLQSLLTDIQRTRSIIDQNLQRADSLVERLRSKLDKDINDALADDTEQKP